jgi:hypothetical protein
MEQNNDSAQLKHSRCCGKTFCFTKGEDKHRAALILRLSPKAVISCDVDVISPSKQDIVALCDFPNGL